LRIWDRKTGYYIVAKNDPRDPETLGDDHISAILRDASGLMWIGTTAGGVYKCASGEAKFLHIKHNRYDPASLARSDVRALFEDSSGQLWVGEDETLDRIDPRTGAAKPVEIGPADGMDSGSVQAIQEDSRGRMWLGTEAGGLVVIEPRTGKRTVYRNDPDRPEGLAFNRVYALHKDRAHPDVLWIGTHGGLNRVDTRRDRWRLFANVPTDPESLGGNVVRAIAEDGTGGLWIGTTRGLNRMDKATGRCARYVRGIEASAGTGLLNNAVTCLLEARDGTIWIGTEGGLNGFDPNRKAWKSWTVGEGLPGSIVEGILEDDSGRIWIGTNRGLAEFDPRSGIFSTYGAADGIQAEKFNPGACLRTGGGEFIFGGVNGYNVFLPGDVKKNAFVPPLALRRLMHGSRNLGLKEPFVVDGALKIPYKIGFMTLEFAALCFIDPGRNRFAYTFEPRDEDWIDLGNTPAVPLAALAPGRYRLRVKGSNPDGVWNEEGLEIPIEIIPPFWRTWWFLAFLAAFVLSGALLVIRKWRRLAASSATARNNLASIVSKFGLTPREAEILRLVLEGAGNKDIEKKLFVSSSTVRNHIYNIYQKLGVKNRVELINVIGKGAGRAF
jgi:DNA-binding CsgD family transcriptional regulator/streptogramin lyase